jgi:Protein of unknown function (DUF732)
MGKSQRSVLDMMRFRGGSRAARVLAVLTALTAWPTSAPAASADSIDVVYFNGLAAHGITAPRLGVAFDLAAAVQLGHAICTDLRAGSAPIEEGMRVYETTDHKITQDQADPAGGIAEQEHRRLHLLEFG